MKAKDKWCEPPIDVTQNTPTNAVGRCNNDRDCRMFYDVRSANKSFVLCGSASVTKNSDFLGSNLYMKCKFLNKQLKCRLYHRFILFSS